MIHLTVLTRAQSRGVPLPFPVSHHSGPGSVRTCPEQRLSAPQRLLPAFKGCTLPSKSRTSMELWKDAANCFVPVTQNTDYVSEKAHFFTMNKRHQKNHQKDSRNAPLNSQEQGCAGDYLNTIQAKYMIDNFLSIMHFVFKQTKTKT